MTSPSTPARIRLAFAAPSPVESKQATIGHKDNDRPQGQIPKSTPPVCFRRSSFALNVHGLARHRSIHAHSDTVEHGGGEEKRRHRDSWRHQVATNIHTHPLGWQHRQQLQQQLARVLPPRVQQLVRRKGLGVAHILHRTVGPSSGDKSHANIVHKANLMENTVLSAPPSRQTTSHLPPSATVRRRSTSMRGKLRRV